MDRFTSKSLVFAAGLIAGLLVAVLADLVGSGPRAIAQVPPPEQVGRYQVSSYGSASSHGAYVIDTQTGHVYHIESNDTFKRIGPLPEPKRR